MFICSGTYGGEKGTVGAVACDIYGNVACATSTGGKTRKWSGRIGRFLLG